MPSAAEKLAASLEVLHALQKRGVVAIQSRDLSRVHRERLIKAGFLQPVMKGWYIASRPDEPTGESTAWYASFWDFCAAYLTERFGDAWCLSPEQSLVLHTGNRTVPRQLLVRSPNGTKHILELPFGTSLMDIKAGIPAPEHTDTLDGLRVYKIIPALIDCGPGFFGSHPHEARAALSMIRNASEILPRLLDGGHSRIAGRLAGAFRNIGKDRVADDILKAMRAAGHSAPESDPFEAPSPMPFTQSASAYKARISAMWQSMAADIADAFPTPPSRPNDIETYLKRVDDAYVADAYHSLSIEGYRVSPALIEKVRDGNWNPDTNTEDRDHRNALAARGYWEAFQAVRESLRAILEGENPGMIVERDHGDWYRQLFSPSVAAGLAKATDLAGYRSGPVYLRNSMYVPPSSAAVLDMMEAFFELLANEKTPASRVVLGHFVFVYIHPYMDGNGRMGRFLMNAMLASAGYNWTIIPVERRNDYMAALETASVGQDIRPFARFIGELVAANGRGTDTLS